MGREYLFFALALLAVLSVSLSFEYYRYSKLTEFDDAVVSATVLRQYTKFKGSKTYEVLQLRDSDGVRFYITSTKPLRALIGYEGQVWLSTRYLSFYDYMKGFVTKGNIVSLARQKALRYRLSERMVSGHADKDISAVYAALYFALALPASLQERFSALGVSHLLAISGFHLGVLSLVLFFLFQRPYRWMQARWFPYRHRNRDLFVFVGVVLGSYLLLLGGVASLLRAYAMMIVGYILHDRGFRIISMQTLFITLLILLALWPRLFFSLGFWLSVTGVYFIFLYLHHFKEIAKRWTFVLLPLWVYLMMVPISLVLFSNYSLWHTSSVLFSILFTVFYPVTLFLHLIGAGHLLDPLLAYYLSFDLEIVQLGITKWWLILYALLSMAAYFYKVLLLILMVVSFGVTVAAVYQVS